MRIKLGATTSSSPLKNQTDISSTDSLPEATPSSSNTQTPLPPAVPLITLHKASRSFPSLLGGNSASFSRSNSGLRQGVEGSADDVARDESIREDAEHGDSVADLAGSKPAGGIKGSTSFGRSLGRNASSMSPSGKGDIGGGGGPAGVGAGITRGDGGAGASATRAVGGGVGGGMDSMALFLKPPTFATIQSPGLDLAESTDMLGMGSTDFGAQSFAVDSMLMAATKSRAGVGGGGGSGGWDREGGGSQPIAAWSSEYFPIEEGLLPTTTTHRVMKDSLFPTTSPSMNRPPSSPLARSARDRLASTSTNSLASSDSGSDYEGSADDVSKLEDISTIDQLSKLEELPKLPTKAAPITAPAISSLPSSVPQSPKGQPKITPSKSVLFSRRNRSESSMSIGSPRSSVTVSSTPQPRGDRKRVGPFLIPKADIPKMKAEMGEELFAQLDLRPANSSGDWDPFNVNAIAEDGTPGYSLSKIYPPPFYEMDIEKGKKQVVSGTLPALVQLLAPEGSIDSDYIADFLTTYRYFAEAVDVARLLIVRYVILTSSIPTGNGSSAGSGNVSRKPSIERKNSKKEDKKVKKEKEKEEKKEEKKGGGFLGLGGSSKASSSQPAPQQEVPETVGIVQLRILNIFKKWVDTHAEDFDENDDFYTLFHIFLEDYVKKDPRRLPFAKAMILNLDAKLRQRDQDIEREEVQMKALEQERQYVLHRTSQPREARGSVSSMAPEASGKETLGRFSTATLRSVLSTQTSTSDLSISAPPQGPAPTPAANPSLLHARRHSAILPASFSSSESLNTTSSPNYTPPAAPLASAFSFSTISRTRSSTAPPTTSSPTSSFTGGQSSSPTISRPITALTDIDPATLATQFTLLEHCQFLRINPRELYHQSWNSSTRSLTSPHLTTLIGWFNRVAYGIATEVVSAPSVKERVTQIKRFVFVAQECFKKGNFNSVFEIVAGLNLGAVARLKRTWRALPKKYWEVWEQLNVLVSSEGSYRTYRSTLKTYRASNPKSPIMPYLGVTLSDLTFTEDGNPTYLETPAHPSPTLTASTNALNTSTKPAPSKTEHLPHINFTKFRLVAALISSLKELQGCGVVETATSPGATAPAGGAVVQANWGFVPDERVQTWLRKEWIAFEDAELYDVSRMMEPREGQGGGS
ncbi:RasGEF [Rhizophlyctis rosea]|uniref:RasGEF n=1 Tax=Rhizophlyctis rosea TaxID=64517 RepID=A0AAD5SEZ0_9FUNG|nr:RasGEF [Rhizophlyctis rosea]